MGLGPGEIVYCLIWEQKNNWKEKPGKRKKRKGKHKLLWDKTTYGIAANRREDHSQSCYSMLSVYHGVGGEGFWILFTMKPKRWTVWSSLCETWPSPYFCLDNTLVIFLKVKIFCTNHLGWAVECIWHLLHFVASCISFWKMTSLFLVYYRYWYWRRCPSTCWILWCDRISTLIRGCVSRGDCSCFVQLWYCWYEFKFLNASLNKGIYHIVRLTCSVFWFSFINSTWHLKWMVLLIL